MDPTLAAFLKSWPLDPWVVVPLVLTAVIYFRGWRAYRRRGSQRLQPHHLHCFLGGLGALFLALASPIEPFAAFLLQVHMVQHLLLMMVAPPLIWLGAPMLPLLRGLPTPIRQHWAGPLLRTEWLRGLFAFLTRPLVALTLFIATTWAWHIPAAYDLALRSPGWHYLEHVCFLAASLLFWWPIIQPYPSRAHGSRWVMIPYLLAADVQNTVLSAILCFAPRVLYPYYEIVPRLWGISALEDQAVAGLLMWVPGSMVFLVPVVWIGSQLLYGSRLSFGSLHEAIFGYQLAPAGAAALVGRGSAGPVPARLLPGSAGRLTLPLVSEPVPSHLPRERRSSWVQRFLGSRHARLSLQVPMLLLAAAVIVDGLLGPPYSPMNLAGVLPWIHWRGLLVLGLLVGGNFFCMACPFLLPRTLARKLLPSRWHWPRGLRSKWVAVGLLVLFFWAYEAFALWDSPYLTAWIALGYFLAPLIIDGLFRGASFCKYVCPIGQFNFVQSLLSPLEIAVRNPETCESCRTKDCIRGRDDVPGCELHLFQPRKSSNMDCTFCLDCVRACPHDNVGLRGVLPGSTLLHDRSRSGLGRLGQRRDLAALVLVLVFAAFANAAGMVAPVVEFQDRLAANLGLASTRWVMTGFLLGGALLLPALAIAFVTIMSRWWSADSGRWLDVATRFSHALVPLGFGMWLAHYGFHFLTGSGTFIPVVQRAAADLSWTGLGEPAWICACCVTPGAWLMRLEIVFLDLGLIASLYLGYRIARERRPQMAQALKALAPWAVLMVALFAFGIWILFQPMEMRGMM